MSDFDILETLRERTNKGPTCIIACYLSTNIARTSTTDLNVHIFMHLNI